MRSWMIILLTLALTAGCQTVRSSMRVEWNAAKPDEATVVFEAKSFP